MSQPNLLLIIADDVTYKDLSLYGGVNVETPRIDALAGQGVVFDRAFLALSMCNPCRTELYTGRYPARNGACWNHSAARRGTKSIVHHLGALGYRVGLAGKKHVGPPKSFPFEDVPGLTPGCVATETKFDGAGMTEFMGRDDKRPFCMVVGLVEAHCPWTMGDYTRFDQAALELPPYMADTEATRRDYAKYLAEIEVLDERVGKTLDALEATGHRDDTLVIFTSEQGAQFPGCKWTNWNTGVHTGFMARWPGRIAAGRRTDAMIQFADVAPTFVDAAGGDPGACDFDGESFLSVLTEGAETHRDYAYAMHNNIPEGPPYPIRAVTDGDYHYIRNLMPEALYIEKHVMGEPKWHDYWLTWMFETTFNERTNKIVNRFMKRPPEQLYRIGDDPFEFNNLADDPDHAEAKARLSAELDAWMKQQGDPGAAIDTQEEWEASKRSEHFAIG